MSEQNRNDFTELSANLDIDALFGTPAPVDFGVPVQTQSTAPTQPQTDPTTTDSNAVSMTQPDIPSAENPAPDPVDAQKIQPETDLFGVAISDSNSISVEQLAAKPPVFSYAAIEQEITDPTMTFEQLREQMSEDLPELEDRGHVSWTMEYNGVTEKISTPAKSIIHEAKCKIESSKKFQESLKKSKKGAKSVVCYVKPTIIAQKKGVMPSYKGIFPTFPDAQASQKAICYIPARDGKIYELRRNAIGEFITPATSIREFTEVQAGFYPALPLIPISLLAQAISFFRAVCKHFSGDYEALLQVYWDKAEEKYILFAPKQQVSRTAVYAELTNKPTSERYLLVMDIHSHNKMPAKFSSIDDADEKATRLYAVIGRLHDNIPEICCRISNGGKYLEVPLNCIFQASISAFPTEWMDNVTIKTQQEDENYALSEILRG